jgi:hypothetical protein
MTSWMRQLAQHYEKTRDMYPNDDLMIVFDIDNTIIDMREMITYVLKGYDRHHRTAHFSGLVPKTLTINENQVDDYLAELGLDADMRRSVNEWYLDRRWTTRPGIIPEGRAPAADFGYVGFQLPEVALFQARAGRKRRAPHLRARTAQRRRCLCDALRRDTDRMVRHVTSRIALQTVQRMG